MGRYRRHLIGLAVVIVLVGVYAAAGFLAVPHFARQAALDFVRTHYGRTLSLGDIRFNPFDFNLDIDKLALPDADGQTLLAFEHLHVGLQLATVWRFAPSFGEILLERPYARVLIRPGGELNLADLGKGFPPPPPSAPAAKPSGPMRLYIARLAVIDGRASFEDHTRPTAFRADFAPIAFELRDFSTTAATGDTYSLNAASPQGERLVWSGNVRLAPLSSHGQFEIADLKARTLWNYLSASLPFEIDSGIIALKGAYDLTSGAGPLGIKVTVASTTVTNLGVKPKGGDLDPVALARIEVDDTQLDVARRRVDVGKVQLAGGEIKAWLGEQGRINLLDLISPSPGPGTDPAPNPGPTTAPPTAIPPTAAPPGPGTGPAPAPAWVVSAPDISVADLKVSAEDRQVTPAARIELDPLSLHVAGFNTSPGDALDVTLGTAVNTSGKLTARAHVVPGTGSVTAHVEAEKLGLQALQPLIAHYTSMTLLKGELAARFDVERRADGYLGVKGGTAIYGLSTVDNALKKDFIKWKELRIADVSYQSQPARLKVGSVIALDPYVRMIIAPDRTVNIAQVLTPPGARPKAPAPAPPPAAAPSAVKGKGKPASRPAAPAAPLTPFPVSIGAVRMVNGSANYTDLWIKPSFALSMEALNGGVTGLSSDPRSRAKVQLDGKVARYSPLHIGGEVNLLSAALYSDVGLSFKDLDLTIANPYSGYFVGYQIDKGKLSVDVSYKVEQRQLTASQHFVVDQLELGNQVNSPGAVHLPLKLAVALLKDRHGVIDLNLPMSGSLDDPHFRIGPIIWKVFVNTIVKAATAPFALLGHLFGGGEHMNIVEFAPGSAELDKSASDQLAALRRALEDRTQLKLDIPIVASAGLDRPQLAQARLQQELQARAQQTRAGKKHPQEAAELALADPVAEYKLLVAQYHADLGKDAPLPPSVLAVEQARKNETPPLDPALADLKAALISHINIPDSDLDQLGRDRAGAVRDAVLADKQIDPARVFIVNAPPKPDSGDKVKVELAVK